MSSASAAPERRSTADAELPSASAWRWTASRTRDTTAASGCANTVRMIGTASAAAS